MEVDGEGINVFGPPVPVRVRMRFARFRAFVLVSAILSVYVLVLILHFSWTWSSDALTSGGQAREAAAAVAMKNPARTAGVAEWPSDALNQPVKG